MSRDWDAATYHRVSDVHVEWARALLDRLDRETLNTANARVMQADLTELKLGEPVDAVFSNAVFHWISDHDRLFARLHEALRPGGRLVAQCGGEGNVAAFLVAARAWLEDWPVVADDPADYLRTVCLGHHLEQLPEELRDGYVRAVLERAGERLDYVRLNITAHA